jgi:hypothetical protein
MKGRQEDRALREVVCPKIMSEALKPEALARGEFTACMK